MGLSSAMNTALSGMRAAESQIDVTGNNLANAQTVGFKASETLFATQFYRTYNLGSAPNANNGGVDPLQVGLGVEVAAVRPDFSQGTIEISSTQTDLAIQGDGFFIVEGPGGTPLYTRNGTFSLSAAQELTSSSGNRLLGWGVDEDFQVQPNTLVPLSVPLGAITIAAPTQNVVMQGNLNPLGDLGEVAEVVDSSVLGDGNIAPPDASGATVQETPVPDASGVGRTSTPGTSGFVAGQQYQYTFTFLDSNGQETTPSSPISALVAADDDRIDLSNLPASGTYAQMDVYRRLVGAPAGDPNADFRLIGTAPQGAALFSDNGIAAGSLLDDTTLNGPYEYVVTFSGGGAPESRPSTPLSLTVSAGRVLLDNLPPIPSGAGVPPYDTINIYRNTLSSPNDYFLVSSVNPGDHYIDYRSDADITNTSDPNYRQANLDGPPVSASTLLTDVIVRNGTQYTSPFEVGDLTYSGTKGGAGLADKTFAVDPTSTVSDLIQFLTQASGIQSGNGIPNSADNLPGSSGGTLAPGGSLTSDGRIRLVSNNGTGNALAIASDAFRMDPTGGTASVPSLGFNSVQQAVGESAVTSFQAYDSLGAPADVRVTMVLESRDDTSATFRWFADSGDNDPAGPDYPIAVGSGLVTFDSQGNMVNTTNNTVTVLRQDIPSVDPLSFQLDLGQLNGFAGTSDIAAAEQDGAPPGTLTSFNVGGDGLIRGIFSNGLIRDLGQIRLARFNNPSGLEQAGENQYRPAPNSGLPIEGNPGEMGIGEVIAGALEMSNTDIGGSLIDLVLASTQYRSNSRVISTAQQLVDELLNLRR